MSRSPVCHDLPVSEPAVLPDTTMRLLLALGEPKSGELFPAHLFIDGVEAWSDDEHLTVFNVVLGTVELHTTVEPGGGLDVHYHVAGGEPTSESPLDPDSSAALLLWAMAAAEELTALIENIEEWSADAADHYMVGNDLYAPESEDPAARLDQLYVQLPGLTLTIPWLGAGEWDLQHQDGSEHGMELTWSATPTSRARVIARARLDELTGEAIIGSADHPGTDVVGLSPEEVVEWLAATYSNHLRWHEAQDAVAAAIIDRVVGMHRP
jgi:hypothetical protein